MDSRAAAVLNDELISVPGKNLNPQVIGDVSSDELQVVLSFLSIADRKVSFFACQELRNAAIKCHKQVQALDKKMLK